MTSPESHARLRCEYGSKDVPRICSSTPIARSTFIEFGIIWMPAPMRAKRWACSYTWTPNPARWSIAATARPPMPAPTIAKEGLLRVIRISTSRGRVSHPSTRQGKVLEFSSHTNRFTIEREAIMGKALEGVRILDMTHVQSGPTCTQILAWFGADVIKVERPGEGDPTRGQLRDIPGADSLYFTMLNANKRGITLNPKTEAGKKIFTKLIEQCDVMVENFAPGAIDRKGFPWEKIQQINPRMIYASVKGFGPGPFEDCKVYENVAQCTGGAASTTGEIDRVPMVTGAQIGDSGTGIHLVAGILAALLHREKSGRGQRVSVAMQDAVLNLCRVKLRDQQRLAHGPLKEYPQYPNGKFGSAVPRAGNASGGGHPGWIVRCKGWENDPDAYQYVITQAQAFPALAKVIGHADWLEDPEYNTPEARLPKLDHVF